MAGAEGVAAGGGIAGNLNKAAKQRVGTGRRAVGEAEVLENQNVVKAATISVEGRLP